MYINISLLVLTYRNRSASCILTANVARNRPVVTRFIGSPARRRHFRYKFCVTLVDLTTLEHRSLTKFFLKGKRTSQGEQ